MMIESAPASQTIPPAASPLVCNPARTCARTTSRSRRRNSPYTVCQGPWPVRDVLPGARRRGSASVFRFYSVAEPRYRRPHAFHDCDTLPLGMRFKITSKHTSADPHTVDLRTDDNETVPLAIPG